MGLVTYLLRADLRARARSLALLLVLAAVVVAAVLTCTAGSQRTRTAFDRYLDRVHPIDALIFDESGDAPAHRVEEIDGVEAAVGYRWFFLHPEGASDEDFFPTFVPDDDRVPGTYLRYPLVHGRHPNPEEPLEVELGERTARRLGVEVGDDLPVLTFTPEQSLQAFGAFEGPRLVLDVVGVVRDPGDVGGREQDVTITLLTPAFGREYDGVVGRFASGVLLDLERPEAMGPVARALAELGEVEFDTLLGGGDMAAQIDPTLSAMADGLRIAALVIALAGGVALAQALARATTDRSDDLAALEALGITTPTLVARVALPGLLAAAAGAVLAVPLAWAASGLLPRDLARRAEPDPGVRFDAGVLVPGALLALLTVAVVAGGIGLLAVRRQQRIAVHPSRPGSAATAAARLGAGVPVVAGLRFAFTSSRGAQATPVRAALGAAALGAVGVLATVVFAGSLHHAIVSPAVYGWSWDAQLSGANGDQIADELVDEEALIEDPAFTAVAEVIHDLEVTIDGDPDRAFVLEDRRGHVPLVVARGVEPVAADEVAMGGKALEARGLDLGDTIEVSAGGPTRTLRIVGVSVLAVGVDGGSSAVGIALRRPAADDIGWNGSCDGDVACSRNYVVVGRPGADVETAARGHGPPSAVEVRLPVPPSEVERLTAIEELPRLLAIALGIIGVVAVAHAATVTVRRRRRDLAVLRVLGLTGRQLRTTVAVQVLALASVGTALGSVLGVALGRAVWSAVAHSTSLPVVTRIPVLPLVVVPLALVAGAHLGATLARRRAGRVRAGIALRTE